MCWCAVKKLLTHSLLVLLPVIITVHLKANLKLTCLPPSWPPSASVSFLSTNLALYKFVFVFVLYCSIPTNGLIWPMRGSWSPPCTVCDDWWNLLFTHVHYCLHTNDFFCNNFVWNADFACNKISKGCMWELWCNDTQEERLLGGNNTIFFISNITHCSITTITVSWRKQEVSSCWDGRPLGHNRHGPKVGRSCCGRLGPI